MKTKNTNRIRKSLRFLFLFLLARVAMAAPAPGAAETHRPLTAITQAR